MGITLFDYLQSELQKKGLNEFVDTEGNLILFDEQHQFMSKILAYDDDIKEIINKLFNGVSLTQREHDEHFKKVFLYRFLQRDMNWQTVEAFKVKLMMTFLTHQDFMNTIYNDMELFITQSTIALSDSTQQNTQETDGETVGSNRQAYAELAQNNVNLNLNDDVMVSANDNTISKNKQQNNQKTDGETESHTISESKSYQFDTLFQSNGLLDTILDIFDAKCFLQIW